MSARRHAQKACCIACGDRAVLARPRDGTRLCRDCFFAAFEDDVHRTILIHRIFQRGQRVAVAASGGKDSTVLAHVLSKLNVRHDYGLDLVLLSVDEGITGYRDASLDAVRRNRDVYGIPLRVVSYAELYGWPMDDIVRAVGRRNNCTFCGVFRRQALDRGAALIGADVIATGHNADDVAETVVMNLLRGDVARLGRCVAPRTGGDGTPAARTGADREGADGYDVSAAALPLPPRARRHAEAATVARPTTGDTASLSRLDAPPLLLYEGAASPGAAVGSAAAVASGRPAAHASTEDDNDYVDGDGAMRLQYSDESRRRCGCAAATTSALPHGSCGTDGSRACSCSPSSTDPHTRATAADGDAAAALSRAVMQQQARPPSSSPLRIPPRVKPFIRSFEKEIVLYAHHARLDYVSTECVYSPGAYRGHAREYIKALEAVRPEAILGILDSAGDWGGVDEVSRGDGDEAGGDDDDDGGGAVCGGGGSGGGGNAKLTTHTRVMGTCYRCGYMASVPTTKTLAPRASTLASAADSSTAAAAATAILGPLCQACTLLEGLNAGTPRAGLQSNRHAALPVSRAY